MQEVVHRGALAQELRVADHGDVRAAPAARRSARQVPTGTVDLATTTEPGGRTCADLLDHRLHRRQVGDAADAHRCRHADDQDLGGCALGVAARRDRRRRRRRTTAGPRPSSRPPARRDPAPGCRAGPLAAARSWPGRHRRRRRGGPARPGTRPWSDPRSRYPPPRCAALNVRHQCSSSAAAPHPERCSPGRRSACRGGRPRAADSLTGVPDAPRPPAAPGTRGGPTDRRNRPRVRSRGPIVLSGTTTPVASLPSANALLPLPTISLRVIVTSCTSSNGHRLRVRVRVAVVALEQPVAGDPSPDPSATSGPSAIGTGPGSPRTGCPGSPRSSCPGREVAKVCMQSTCEPPMSLASLQVVHGSCAAPRPRRRKSGSRPGRSGVADLRDRVVLDRHVPAGRPDPGVIRAVGDEALDHDVVRLGVDARHLDLAGARVGDRRSGSADGDLQRIVAVAEANTSPGRGSSGLPWQAGLTGADPKVPSQAGRPVRPVGPGRRRAPAQPCTHDEPMTSASPAASPVTMR